MAKRLGELDVGTDIADTDKILVQQSGVDKQAVISEFPLPLNYIAGVITSNGTDADHDIDIAPGIARSDDDTVNMRLPVTGTKQIDAAWAAGTNVGGLDTGSVAADTLYAIWLIKKPNDGVADVLFSTSFTSPTMPADYTKKRLIGAVLTEGSANIEPYTQNGDHFFYYPAVMPLDLTDSGLVDNVYETATLSAPPSSIALIIVVLTGPVNATEAAFLIRQTAGGGASIHGKLALTGVTSISMRDTVRMLLDSNRQLEYTTDGAPTACAFISMTTTGFEMLTRSNP